MSDQQVDQAKRTWLIASGCAGAVGGLATAVPFVSTFSPSERAKAAGASVPYPGETAVRTFAEEQCYAQFEPWMGVPWTESDYDIESFYPSSQSWPKGDRTITCTVVEFQGKRTTGSVRGAKT